MAAIEIPAGIPLAGRRLSGLRFAANGIIPAAMATQPEISPPGSGPQIFVPPSTRELRAQAVHRLQIGLVGLATMLLLVGLANIIMDRARLADADRAPSGIPTADVSPKSDPLADIGVVPSPEAKPPASQDAQ